MCNLTKSEFIEYLHEFVLYSVHWNQVHTGHFGHTGEHFISAAEECKVNKCETN